MRTLGISCFYHDSAAALVEDGNIVAAAQEERFTRRKHDSAFPINAVAYCLEEARIRLDDVDHICFYERPMLKFRRLVATYLTLAPSGFDTFREAIPLWLREKLYHRRLIRRELRHLARGPIPAHKIQFSEHHLSHAASAFLPSPFREAAVLTLDGVGEWATSSAGFGRDSHVEILKEIHFPHSLGMLYSAFTSYVGFKVNSGEYKLMGLAPYGSPIFAQQIFDELVDVKADGSFRVNQSYFDYASGRRMTNGRFHDLFGGTPRRADEPLTRHHMDIAASMQAVTDEVFLRLTRALAAETGMEDLCLAGGVALNCVANGKVLRDRSFSRIWIQPAAGDAGGAIGAALWAWYRHSGSPRPTSDGDSMHGSFLGPRFDQDEIERRLDAVGARFVTVDEQSLIESTAHALARGECVGWFQGRMEFGPRALGARSILADPRSATMQRTLNLKVKFREGFRPFAPAVLQEDVSDWFELECESPYMLLVADVRPHYRSPISEQEASLEGFDKLQVARSQIPAVTHVDNSARIQTVHAETNPQFHALIRRFKAITGCPVIVNTSFNVRGEPIVCTPEDAFRCFMGTDIDMLAIGRCLLVKAEQAPSLRGDYKLAFEPD